MKCDICDEAVGNNGEKLVAVDMWPDSKDDLCTPCAALIIMELKTENAKLREENDKLKLEIDILKEENKSLEENLFLYENDGDYNS